MNDAARARLEHWKQSLLDLTPSNALLDAKDGKTCVALAADPQQLASALAAGGGLALAGLIDGTPENLGTATTKRVANAASAEAPVADTTPVATSLTNPESVAFVADVPTAPTAIGANRLNVVLSDSELPSRLTAMSRANHRAREDRGEHVLWLGLGMLTWTDAGGPHRAPLVLWPVEIERVAGGSPRLLSAVEPGWLEPEVNHTLAEKLRREFEIVVSFDLTSSSLALASPGDLSAALAAADGIALTRPGWRVERAGVLGCFAPLRFSLWRELDLHGEALLAHPIIAQLAEGNGAPAFAQPSSAAAAAVTARPNFLIPGTGPSEWATDLLAPLDADASQLQAVSAAGAGASFVLQAPPGTGATQTIANLIVHCVGTAKSVLLVSDRMAALEAVQQRLASIGLGDLCLPTGSRAQITGQLERVLTRAFRPGGAPSLLDGARLAELRQVLDGHASSLHRIGAFGRSIHDVMGRLVELRTTPRAQLADIDAVGLNAATFDRRRAAVDRLAVAAANIEPVASHPWRASTLDREAFGAVGDGRDRALSAIEAAATAAAALRVAARDVASLVPGSISRTRDQLQALGALAALAAASPRPGAELLTPLASRSRGISEQLDEQIALIRARGGGKSLDIPRDPLLFLLMAKRQRALAREVDEKFTSAVDQLDAGQLWTQLRKWTNSMAPVRFVALRAARAEVKTAAQSLQLETDAAMIAALEAVIAERACRAALLASAEPAKRWFGELGGDPLKLDLDAIEEAVRWGVELRRAFDALDLIGDDKAREVAWRSLVAHVAAGNDDASLGVFGRLAEAVARWLPALAELAAATGIDLASATGDDHLAMLDERTATLRHAIDDLADWVTFHDARHAALAAGVGPAVGAIERGDLSASDLAAAWERATLLAWADAELADSQVAAHGAAHHAHVAAFADLDRAALALVRSRALVRFAERVPTAAPGKLDSDSDLGRLLGALRAKTDVPAIRSLLAIAPTVISAIAPCIAVTPLGLARHLDPALRFDVVVIDQAAQLSTAEAIAALSRGAAAVIVGDRQLGRDLDDVQSAARAARLPELRLSTHYRSRHADVFGFANERYYEDRLHVFPAVAGSPDLGVTWRRGDATPETTVAEIAGRLRDPEQRGRSLAVIAFSDADAERIEDLLDATRAADPTIELPTGEPLVIATADSAHALVRDVVIVAAGDVSSIGDPRRLAVALTRAREQLIVLAPSLPTGDLPVVADLAAVLARSERVPAGNQPASPITDAIARALAERGWQVRHQVGDGAYRIDLAVVDPSAADGDRFVLAIELDGPIYASAPAARDRDRLRGEQLTQLGWRLHRMWAMDWWSDPEREIQRAHGAIVTAVAASRRNRPAISQKIAQPAVMRVPRATRPPLDRAEKSKPVIKEISAPIVSAIDSATLPTLAAGSAPIRIARNTIPIGPYVAAAIPPGRRTPDDLFAPRHLAELGKVVEQVLAAEAPIHLDLLARRVGAYFGIGRVSQRVTDQVKTAVLGRGKLGDEDNIVWRRDQDPGSVPGVRVAGSSPTGRRDITEIPLAELASAARIIVERAAGIATTDLVRDAARLIGFARITPDVSDRIAMGVKLAQVRELIRIESGKASLPPS